MTDGIQKGTGNAYALQTVANALSLYPTHEAFMQAWAAGQVFADLKINPEGWDPLGTSLNKANLLKDATAALYGLGSDATPDNIFGKRLLRVATGSYRGNDQDMTKDNPKILRFGFKPEITIIQDDNAMLYTINRANGALVFPWDAVFFTQEGSYPINTTNGNSTATSIYFKKLDDGALFYLGNTGYDYSRILNSSAAKYNYIAIG